MTAKVSKKNSFSTLSYQVLWLGSGIRPPRTIPLGPNIQFDVNGTGGVSPEIIALQALQNMYQSASSAVSKNIRKNKAKIKYNTIVYLINTQQE